MGTRSFALWAFAGFLFGNEVAAQTQTGAVAVADARIERLLVAMGETGNDKALDAALRELRADGPVSARAAFDSYNRWTRLELEGGGATAAPARPGEMRWRAVYVLGSLGVADARRPLYEIARRPLPDPRHDEQRYADDYRVKLRAIAGLEQLKAVDELKALHELGGTWRNPTATALYELGVDVGNVSRIDARTALAADTIDLTDFKRSQGRAAQPRKPGSTRFKVKPRGDTPKSNPSEGERR